MKFGADRVADPGDGATTAFALARALWESGHEQARALRRRPERRKPATPRGDAAKDLLKVDRWLAQSHPQAEGASHAALQRFRLSE